MRSTLLPVGLVAISLCACVAPPQAPSPEQSQRDIAASVDVVVPAATGVFAEYAIPIANSDAKAGVVQSAQFTVDGMWGDRRMTDRVDCGKDMVGSDRALGNSVTLTVGAVVQPNAAGGSTVRLVVNAMGYDKIAQAQASRNAVAAGLSGGFPCVLKPAFVAELLDAIAGRAGAGTD